MSVTQQIQEFNEEPVSPEHASRSAERAAAAERYGCALRSVPMTNAEEGSLVPLLDTYRAELVDIDNRYPELLRRV